MRWVKGWARDGPDPIEWSSFLTLRVSPFGKFTWKERQGLKYGVDHVKVSPFLVEEW